MYAEIRYENTILWEAPGGAHYKKFLKQGDFVEVDKSGKFPILIGRGTYFYKVMHEGTNGYVEKSNLKFDVNYKPEKKEPKKEEPKEKPREWGDFDPEVLKGICEQFK